MLHPGCLTWVLNYFTIVPIFQDLPVQCIDGTILCQRLTMSLLGPLIGRALSGVEEPVLILPDNTCQDLTHLIQMVWDQVLTGSFRRNDLKLCLCRKLLRSFQKFSSLPTTGQISGSTGTGLFSVPPQARIPCQASICLKRKEK